MATSAGAAASDPPPPPPPAPVEMPAVGLDEMYVYDPLPDCSSGGARLGAEGRECARRASFSSVVGIGRKDGDEVVFSCTGQLMDSTTVITADHCFHANQRGTPVILLHFAQGSAVARREGDNASFSGLRIAAVSEVIRDPVPRSATGPWDYDIALLRLETPVSAGVYPRFGTGLPDPPKMTMAGWGYSNRPITDGVALSVTSVRLPSRDNLQRYQATLQGWNVAFSTGGRSCKADSGGPVFSGLRDRLDGNVELLGLIAGTTGDCTGGDQLFTDLTMKESRDFLCRLAQPHNLLRPLCAARGGVGPPTGKLR